MHQVRRRHFHYHLLLRVTCMLNFDRGLMEKRVHCGAFLWKINMPLLNSWANTAVFDCESIYLFFSMENSSEYFSIQYPDIRLSVSFSRNLPWIDLVLIESVNVFKSIGVHLRVSPRFCQFFFWSESFGFLNPS